MLHLPSVTSMAQPIEPAFPSCQVWTLFTGCPNISHTPDCTDTMFLVSEATKVLLLFVPQK